jgi:hypothetical protein
VGSLETAADLLSPLAFAIATGQEFDIQEANDEAILSALEAGNLGAIVTLVSAGFRHKTLLRLCGSLWRRGDVTNNIVLACKSLGRVRRRVAKIAPPSVAAMMEESFRRADWLGEGARQFLTGDIDEVGTAGMRSWFVELDPAFANAFGPLPSEVLKAGALRLGTRSLLEELAKRGEESWFPELRLKCPTGGLVIGSIIGRELAEAVIIGDEVRMSELAELAVGGDTSAWGPSFEDEMADRDEVSLMIEVEEQAKDVLLSDWLPQSYALWGMGLWRDEHGGRARLLVAAFQRVVPPG